MLSLQVSANMSQPGVDRQTYLGYYLRSLDNHTTYIVPFGVQNLQNLSYDIYPAVQYIAL
jgi:hypothetical protein